MRDLTKSAILVFCLMLVACAEMPETVPAMQQAAASPETPAQQRERQCKGAMGAAMMAPTKSGTFNESMSNANTAYYNCMAGLPPAAPQPQPPPKRVPLKIDCRPYNNTLGTYGGVPKPPDGYTCEEQ